MCHSDSNDIFDADVFHGQFESSISGALDCFFVTISAYLIYVEYMDYTLQERLTELGIKEDGKIDTLLPNSSIDSRLAEMERKIAADRAILAKYFGESGIMPDEALLEEKEEETDEEKDSDRSSEEQISGNRDGKKKEKKKDRKKDKED